MAKVEKVRLGDIVLDESIQHRKVNEFKVSEYRERFRTGQRPPPLVLERGSRRLVCGQHRYKVYRSECEPSTMIDCYCETYENELALWKRAVADNMQHGRELDTFDKKKIADKLKELGGGMDDIAMLLGVTVDRLAVWAGEVVIVFGKRDGQEYEEPRPVKHGMKGLVGTRMEEEKYMTTVERRGSGVPIQGHAFALRHLIQNGCAGEDEQTLAELRLTYNVLGEWLNKRVELVV